MAKYDKVWLDQMYDNRGRVADHARYFARWGSASIEARRSHARRLDVRYGPGLAETLDIFPSTRDKAPVVVFIHGGYWRSLDKSEHSFLAPALVRHGACVVIPNYALCPAVTIPQLTLQMVHALAWTWRHIARYGADPNRITVIGHSAGGHLAAMMLACQWKSAASDLPASVVKNALSISGLYELESVMHTPFLQDSLRLTPSQVRRVSPAWLPRPPIRRGRGALACVTGADESAEFLRHNALLQTEWGKRVVPICEILPGLNHFSILETLCQPGQRLHALALDLLYA